MLHSRQEVVNIIDELYREGLLVKALDESRQPLLRNGQQVYKAVEHATDAELAFWRQDNVN
jgi:hypothetical protein